MSDLITCDPRKLELSHNALREFLKFDEENYSPFIMKGHAVVNHNNLVVKGVEHVIACFDRNDSSIDCKYITDDEAIYFEDLPQVPTVPYTWNSNLPKYINSCLELEAIEQSFNFAEWKLYCVLNDININNYDKYKSVLNFYKKYDMPHDDIPIGRAYEITKLPLEAQNYDYLVNGKIVPLSKLNIQQIKQFDKFIKK